MLSCRSLSLCVVLAAASASAVAPATAPGAASYKLPAAGTWHVQNVFPDVIGGSMVVAGSRRQVKRLELTPSREKADSCGSSVRLRSRMSIRRLGDDDRPAVGTVPLASPVIRPASASVTVRGKRRKGRLLILWDRAGRRAFSAELKAGGCSLSFALAR